MIFKGLGQYDQEYMKHSCFWGTKPGKYVSLLLDYLKVGRILDLGAGEGKNSIYLAEHGFNVIAVECSGYAIENFKKRLERLDSSIRERIEIIQADVQNYLPSGKFEAVIAYGLLHCLPSLEALHKVIHLMQLSTAGGGYNVIATFTNALPLPDVQHYLEPTFVNVGYLPTFYYDWQIISYEDDIIEEMHPTSKILHKHSICRLLARRSKHD